jgi:hypothetical protein
MVKLWFVISNSHLKIWCPNSHMQCPELWVPSPEFRVSGFGTQDSGLGAWDIACGSSDIRFSNACHIHILHAMLFHIFWLMCWVVLSFDLSRAMSPKSQDPKFGTRGSGHIKRQHNPTHKSRNMKQHCMQNMNMIGIQKSDVRTATCNVPNSESRVPNFGFRSSGFGELELGNHVRSQGISDIGDQMFVFSVSFLVFCLVVSRLLLSQVPNPETRNSGLRTRSLGHCMWQFGHQIFECLSYSYFACNVVSYVLIYVLGCVVFRFVPSHESQTPTPEIWDSGLGTLHAGVRTSDVWLTIIFYILHTLMTEWD